MEERDHVCSEKEKGSLHQKGGQKKQKEKMCERERLVIYNECYKTLTFPGDFRRREGKSGTRGEQSGVNEEKALTKGGGGGRGRAKWARNLRGPEM